MKLKLDNEYRPMYHFSTKGWINDPNGFVYFNGKYHLFFQHYADGPFPGPMSWGHAISDDLITWEVLEDAFTHDSIYDKDGCWSGSAIVKDDILYIMYTGNMMVDGLKYQTQNLVISTDGLTFTKYENNPVISEKDLPNNGSVHDFRDPSLFYDNENYYLLLGNKTKNNVATLLKYKSKDLINWEFDNIVINSNELGYMIECPTSMMMNKDTRVLVLSPQGLKPKGNEFWNIYSSIYLFSDKDLRLVNLKNVKELDHGFDFYAPIIINDGNIMIAWMGMWEREFPLQIANRDWNHCLTLPRIIKEANGKLIQKPIKTLESYFTNRTSFKEEIKKETSIKGLKGKTLHFQVNFSAKDDLTIKWNRKDEFYLKLTYNNAELSLSRTHTYIPVKSYFEEKSAQNKRKCHIDSKKITLDFYLDNMCTEIFINNGEEVMSLISYHPLDFDNITFKSKNGVMIEGYFEYFKKR